MLTAVLIISVLSLITSLITLNRLIGLKPWLRYELSVVEQAVKVHLNIILKVFTPAKRNNTRP